MILLGCVLFGGIVSSHALVITPVWDSTITSDVNAATIESTINSAIAIYQTDFSDPISVSIKFQETSSGLGSSSTFIGNITYSSFRSALAADATTANDTTTLAHLPVQANNPVNGNANVTLTTANLRAIGFTANPPGGIDSTISLNTSLMNLSRLSINPSKYDLMAVASHEMDEALGFGSALNGLANGAAAPSGAVFSLDLLRYDQTGARSFNTTLASQAYLSINGTTDLARFNQTAGGDFSDFYSPGGQTPEVQDAFGTPGSTPNLGVELTMLDVIGYNLVAVPEPGTVAFLGLGALALLRRGKKN
jgi:PEP-CTERM motif